MSSASASTWTEEPGRLRSMGSRRVRHDWATSLSFFPFLHWRRKWQPTPVFLPGESQGRGSLVGCHLWGLRIRHDWSDLAAAAVTAHQASLSITNSQSLLKRISIESVMSSNHLILCRPLFLPPSIFPSIWVFSKESVLRIRWPKYWSFSFSISPSNEYSGLDFLLDWLVWFPCSPRASQESSPIPQLKSINSLVLSFLYSPTLTSIHDCWKNHSFD